jgi:hypothetical protein
MSVALRVRWAWSLRTEAGKPWRELASPMDEQVRGMFNTAARMLAMERSSSGWTNG